jgi:hypothetical protein
MKGSDHARRPELERDGPQRGFPQMKVRPLGTAARPTGPTAAAPPSGGKPVEHVVADAVRRGYEVVEENIRQGRQAAERLRQGTYRPGEIPGEMSAVVNRLVRLGAELSTAWFQMIAAVMRDPRLAAAFEDVGQPRPPSAGRPPRRTATPRITHRIHGSRTCDVSYNVSPLSTPAIPTVPDLVCSDYPGAPVRVAVRGDPDSGALVLHIEVTEAHPAGTYRGNVIDRNTRKRIGTVELRIPD